MKENKVVMITGSSGGIGWKTALYYLERGYKVAINGRNEMKLLAKVQELEQLTDDFDYFLGDLSKLENCEKFVNQVYSRWGRIDVLVNNCCQTQEALFKESCPIVFADVFDSGFKSSVFMTRMALGALIESKGSVIFVSSIAGFTGLPASSAYCSSKMALSALWHSLRLELKDSVHVGICYLGFTQNDKDKVMLNAKGSSGLVPKRSSFFRSTQERVAKHLYRMSEIRKPQKIIGSLGVFLSIMTRFFPGLTYQLMDRFYK